MLLNVQLVFRTYLLSPNQVYPKRKNIESLAITGIQPIYPQIQKFY